MKQPIRVGGFERRLVLFFLLLSVPPTLLIAFFSARYVMRSMQMVSAPAVEQSFTNSMEIARDFSAKLEEDASSAAERLADEAASSAGESLQPGPTLEGVLARVSAETRADFTAVYSWSGDAWSLEAAYPEGMQRIEDRLEIGGPLTEAGGGPGGGPSAALEARLPFSDPDVVASGVVRGKTLFAAGYALPKGFTEKMRKTADDLGRYRAVGFYVSVMRRYIVIVTSVLVVLLAVASTLLSRLLARRISQPITELAHATEMVAKGDLDYRVRVAARDEVASLVTGFNKMTEELQENKRNLIRAERIAAWRDVARRIAHEIKNPLTPIEIAIYRIKKRIEAGGEGGGIPAGAEGAGAEWAQDAGASGGEGAGAESGAGREPARAGQDRRVIEESLDSILKEVAALKTIAQEFSSFARLPEPRFESLDVNEILKSVLELYSSSSQNVRVETALGSLPHVRADRDQMRSVLSNLVKNAIEAMPSGGTLSVRTMRAAVDAAGSRFARIEISDTGAGIPEEIRDHIFDPYFTTKAGGTGVGLALAYRILTDHKGKIGFRTGKDGTTFTVDLPVAES
jgi:nitrogen fixation/metabolism regulation signal transduction histidine kinase